jgi:hypothetical protein
MFGREKEKEKRKKGVCKTGDISSLSPSNTAKPQHHSST